MDRARRGDPGRPAVRVPLPGHVRRDALGARLAGDPGVRAVHGRARRGAAPRAPDGTTGRRGERRRGGPRRDRRAPGADRRVAAGGARAVRCPRLGARQRGDATDRTGEPAAPDPLVGGGAAGADVRAVPAGRGPGPRRAGVRDRVHPEALPPTSGCSTSSSPQRRRLRDLVAADGEVPVEHGRAVLDARARGRGPRVVGGLRRGAGRGRGRRRRGGRRRRALVVEDTTGAPGRRCRCRCRCRPCRRDAVDARDAAGSGTVSAPEDRLARTGASPAVSPGAGGAPR